jgi:c-di-GMP-binding flagellar brake protein YcgR
MSEPGVDHPEVDSEADITLTGRGISVSSRVEYATDAVVVVRPSTGDYVEQVVARVGDKAEVFWRHHEEGRSFTAEVAEVEEGAVPRWSLTVTGEAEHSQRRRAVRARVSVPVKAQYQGGTELVGEAVDMSENGMRALIDGWGLPPEPGMKVDLVLDLGDGSMKVVGEILRQQSRGARWLMSIKFLNLQEKDEDRLRRRVFQALREERARDRD